MACQSADVAQSTCYCTGLSTQAIVQVRTLTPPPAPSGVAAGEVTRIALTADGEQLAAGHADGSIRLWRYAAGQCQVPTLCACIPTWLVVA